MRLYVFDDAVADEWAPFSLTRPCGELLYGRWLLRERLERFAGTRAAGHLSREWLSDFRETGAPTVTAPGETPPDTPRLFLSSRAVPSPDNVFDRPGKPTTLRMDDRVIGCWLPPGRQAPAAAWLQEPEALAGAREVELQGEVLEEPWDLVSGGPERLADDLRRLADEEAARGGAPPDELPRGVERLGDQSLHLGPDVRLEPGVLLDLREGPIVLDAGVEVLAGARLAGPLYAGRHSRLLGGPISAVTAGPFSYLRGELEDTVILGYSNKAHDGFLGHAYLGRWVNLGAMTTNSDLKNNYGTIRIGPPGRQRDTGLLKLGCFLGDHVKTGIGVLLNTGTVIGAGSNVFGAAMPPKWVPPFSWGRGDDLGEYRKDAFLDTARTVMERRGVSFDSSTSRWLAAVCEAAQTGRPDPAEGA